jgi:hypothetical protein
MSTDPNARFQEHMEFTQSHWYPELVALEIGKTANSVSSVEFSRADLMVLREKMDELLGCTACADSRHQDCSQHHDGKACGCDQRTLHRQIFSEQAALYRASRRR